MFVKINIKPNFRGAFIFEDSELVSVRMGESTVTLDKPIFDGQTTLDCAKVLMYDWHYGEMKPKYGSNIDLCYTDTDSFIRGHSRGCSDEIGHQRIPGGSSVRPTEDEQEDSGVDEIQVSL